jgi:hypothetical protein
MWSVIQPGHGNGAGISIINIKFEIVKGERMLIANYLTNQSI